jgi:hypothetical protein
MDQERSRPPVFQVWRTCGKKAAVVRHAATKPRVVTERDTYLLLSGEKVTG